MQQLFSLPQLVHMHQLFFLPSPNGPRRGKTVLNNKRTTEQWTLAGTGTIGSRAPSKDAQYLVLATAGLVHPRPAL